MSAVKSAHCGIKTKRSIQELTVTVPRPRTQSREQLVDSAMAVFWKNGYFATSMEDLVSATGVSRGGIYTDFGGKEALFLASLSAYRERFAAPAIAILLGKASGTHERQGAPPSPDDTPVEGAPQEGLAAIDAYFDFFIKLHRRRGMPGPGCFCGNVMAELASHDDRVRDVIVDHMRELQSAFLHALVTEFDQRGCTIAPEELESMAHFLAIASQGLWARARSLTEVAELTRYKETLMALLASHLDRCALAQSNSPAAVDHPSGQR
jgi:TetR/AcrR family transcriptional repressor of nem operon